MKKCVYDYKNSCTCAEDDKCGCDYDNNMAHDVTCDFEEHQMLKNHSQKLKQLADTEFQNLNQHQN